MALRYSLIVEIVKRVFASRWTRRGAAVLALALVALVCIVNQRSGHDWGDDFALYINQSRGLVEGNVGDVIATNRYTLNESTAHSFSPLAYPWGTPILLSPVVALFGINFPVLKLVGTACFLVFLWVFWRLMRRRVGGLGATALTGLIALSPSYVGWTDVVLSEMPFICFTAITLWWIDRCRDLRAWTEGSLRPLVMCGLLVGFTYSIRREGIALVFAVAAAQAVVALSRGRRRPGPIPWRRLAVPHLSTAGFVVGLQLLLPGPVIAGADGLGLTQIWPNLKWYVDILGEHIALKDMGPADIDFFGYAGLGMALFVLFGVLALLGIIERLVAHLEEDAFLVAYLVMSALVVLVLPFHEGRYLLAITPVIAYFAYQGIASTFTDAIRPGSRWALVPRVVAVALVAVLMVGNGSDLWNRTRYRLVYDYGHWGPEHPASQEMFRAVRDHTRGDEILVFFRARAMNLYVERTTLQTGNLDHILTRADWYVMEKASTYYQALVTPEKAAEVGLEMVWENDRFVLWRVPDR